MNSSMDVKPKSSDVFLAIYSQLLRGKEGDNQDSTLDRVRSKHGGLAILRSLEDNKECTIELIGRELLVKYIPAGVQKPISEISRLQFAVISSKKTGNRFLIDLGSIGGTTLLDCKKNYNDQDARDVRNEMQAFLKNAEQRCFQDNIHGDLYPAFKSLEEIRGMSAVITRSYSEYLPEPYSGKIKLQSGLQKFDWYPLPNDAEQDFKISDFIFTINKDSSIKARKMPPIAADSPFAPAAADLKTKQAEIRIFNAYLDAYRNVKNNYALKGAIEEIDRAGGIEKMEGYPESFKCPVLCRPMTSPMIDEYGHTIESSITALLSKCPKTNIPYTPQNQFKPNEALNDLMTQFYKIKGLDPNKLIEDQMKTQIFKK